MTYEENVKKIAAKMCERMATSEPGLKYLHNWQKMDQEDKNKSLKLLPYVTVVAIELMAEEAKKAYYINPLATPKGCESYLQHRGLIPPNQEL